MKNAVIVEETIQASAEKVWEALTNKEKMKHWYFDLSDFKAEEGFEFSFPGQGHKGEKYVHRCKIIEVIPMKKLKYSWRYETYAGYSEVTFDLFPEGEDTLVRVTHIGLDSFPSDNPDFALTSFDAGWTELITKQLPHYLRNA
jgi:uncharacterized protein YndB with AHSA1/START domain